MWSLRLGLVSLALVIGCGIADRAQAQAWGYNYYTQKPSRIFAQNCSNCHASPKGLVRRVSPGYLPQFLRDHFTAWETADRMAAWLLARQETKSRSKPRAATKPPAAAGADGQPAKREATQSKRRAGKPAAAKSAAPSEKPAATPDDSTLSPETRRAKEDYERGKSEDSGKSAPESETPASESAPRLETPAPMTRSTEPPAAEKPASESPAAESPAAEKPASESPASETPADDGKTAPAEPAEESH